MGKKYIIEIIGGEEGDMDFSTIEPYTEPDMEQVRKEAYQKGYETGYEDGYNEPGKNQQEAYQCGLNDAWDTMKKIRGMTWNEQKEVFGTDYFTDIIALPASECIEKIRQYEQEKEEQIQVGDEVATDAGNRATVLYEDPDGTQVFVFKSDGTAAWWTKSALHRTGRNFPEIASVLEKMREESNG